MRPLYLEKPRRQELHLVSSGSHELYNLKGRSSARQEAEGSLYKDKHLVGDPEASWSPDPVLLFLLHELWSQQQLSSIQSGHLSRSRPSSPGCPVMGAARRAVLCAVRSFMGNCDCACPSPAGESVVVTFCSRLLPLWPVDDG